MRLDLRELPDPRTGRHRLPCRHHRGERLACGMHDDMVALGYPFGPKESSTRCLARPAARVGASGRPADLGPFRRRWWAAVLRVRARDGRSSTATTSTRHAVRAGRPWSSTQPDRIRVMAARWLRASLRRSTDSSAAPKRLVAWPRTSRTTSTGPSGSRHTRSISSRRPSGSGQGRASRATQEATRDILGIAAHPTPVSGGVADGLIEEAVANIPFVATYVEIAVPGRTLACPTHPAPDMSAISRRGLPADRPRASAGCAGRSVDGTVSGQGSGAHRRGPGWRSPRSAPSRSPDTAAASRRISRSRVTLATIDAQAMA